MREQAVREITAPFAAAMLLGAATLAGGCGDGKSEQTVPEGEAQATAGGEASAGGTAEDMDAPEGSVAPEQDPGAGQGQGQGQQGTGQQGAGGTASGGDGSPAGGGSSAGDGGQGTPSGESRWGKTRAQQCQQKSRPQLNSSARSAVQRGRRAAKSGNLGQARSAFQKAANADNNAYPALYNLGVIAARQGKDDTALDYYRRALRVQPDYEKAAKGIVSIYLKRGSVPDAMAFIEPLARKYEANKALQALYAEVLVEAERYDEAWEAARKALRCDERFLPAMIALVKASLAQGREELATSIMEEQAFEIDKNNAELHYIRGKMLLGEPGRLREAMDHLRKAVRNRPDYLEARMLLGEQLLSGANYKQALKHFEAAANLAPDLLSVHLNLADAYRSTEQWNKAKAEFKKVLQQNPDLPEAHYNMALMYQQAGGDFPGMDKLQAMEKAVAEFKKYRDLMGPRLPREDPTEAYLEDLQRQIEREKRRRERKKERSARESGGEGDG